MNTARRKLHILAMARTSPFHCRGGFEDHIDTLYSGLASLGHQISFLTTAHPDEPQTTQLQKNGIDYYFLPNAKSGTYSPAWDKLSVAFTKTFITKNAVDLIHAQSIGALSILKKRLHKRYNIPVVISYHGTNYDEYCSQLNILHYTNKGNFLKRWKLHCKFLKEKRQLDHPCHKEADIIIATSNEQKSIFEKIYCVSSKKIKTVFNGMNIDNFKPEKPDSSLIKKYHLKNKKVILGLARFVEDKGLQFLIPAFAKLLKEKPECTLLLVGKGPFEPELRTLVSKYGINDNVIFTGAVPFDQLPKYFHLADMFINYTIRQNGYDLTLVEAMACECIVLASDIGSHATLVQSEKNGYLIQPGNPDLLMNKIRYILNNKKESEALAKHARQTIITSFTDTHMVKETENIYVNLINAFYKIKKSKK